MNKRKETICILPARIGSKRVKKKNIKLFSGKPIIYYPIKQAKKSNLFKEIYVSTDSKEISKIVTKFGARVPFLRHKNISDDKTGTEKVIRDFVKKIDTKDIKYIFCIYPASPLIKSEDFKKALKKFKRENLDYLVSVGKFSSNPERSFVIKKDRLIPKNKKNINKNSQNFVNQFYDTGNFYIYSKKYLLNKSRINIKPGYYLIESLRALDVNTIEDFKKAEKIYKKF